MSARACRFTLPAYTGKDMILIARWGYVIFSTRRLASMAGVRSSCIGAARNCGVVCHSRALKDC